MWHVEIVLSVEMPQSCSPFARDRQAKYWSVLFTKPRCNKTLFSFWLRINFDRPDLDHNSGEKFIFISPVSWHGYSTKTSARFRTELKSSADENDLVGSGCCRGVFIQLIVVWNSNTTLNNTFKVDDFHFIWKSACHFLLVIDINF